MAKKWQGRVRVILNSGNSYAIPDDPQLLAGIACEDAATYRAWHAIYYLFAQKHSSFEIRVTEVKRLIRIHINQDGLETILSNYFPGWAKTEIIIERGQSLARKYSIPVFPGKDSFLRIPDGYVTSGFAWDKNDKSCKYLEKAKARFLSLMLFHIFERQNPTSWDMSKTLRLNEEELKEITQIKENYKKLSLESWLVLIPRDLDEGSIHFSDLGFLYPHMVENWRSEFEYGNKRTFRDFFYAHKLTSLLKDLLK